MDSELEVKFYLVDLPALENRLRELGANQSSLRTYELNLRFDTRDGSLSRARQVLRLRQDANARITFKGASQDRADVTARQEIEFEVSDFAAARRMLEALGYQVVVSYEKYRTTYELEGVEVTLDELPYGNFCEVEGPDAESILGVANHLKLEWDKRIMDSYLALFAYLNTSHGLEIHDLTFANFDGMSFMPEDLGVHPADRP